MLTEKNSKILLWIGFFLFITGILIFSWGENLNLSDSIDTSKISGFGDFIGGAIRSIWSLAGVILFYVALTEQREDIKINRETLKAQVNALNQQIKEFKLQKFELKETRKVFEEQGQTLKVQRFENTFFQLINLHHEIIDKLSFDRRNAQRAYEGIDKREIISKGVEDLLNKIDRKNKISIPDSSGGRIYHPSNPENKNIAEERLFESYREFYFEDYKQLLSHYYRNVYHIFKFIFTTDLIPNNKKQFYATLVRAQLSSDELLLIAYNSIVPGLGYPNFLFLVEEYDILQNFDLDLIFKFDFHEDIYKGQIQSLDKIEIEKTLRG